MFQRIVVSTLIFVLALSLTACSSPEKEAKKVMIEAAKRDDSPGIVEFVKVEKSNPQRFFAQREGYENKYPFTSSPQEIYFFAKILRLEWQEGSPLAAAEYAVYRNPGDKEWYIVP